MKRTVWSMLALGVVLVSSRWAEADVTDVRENSFSILSKVSVPGTPKSVYAEFARPDRWWDPQHTWSGSAKNLTLELRAGGCFCERLADGGSVQHGQIIYVQPNVQVRLDAPLGPLQDMAVTGVLTFKFAPGEKTGETLVTMTYHVSGAFSMESAKLAPIVDQVLSSQLQRLRDDAASSPH